MPENEHTMVLVSIDQKAALAAGKNTTASKMRVAVDFTALSPEVREFLAGNIEADNLEIPCVCYQMPRGTRYVSCQFKALEPTQAAVVAEATRCLQHFEQEAEEYRKHQEEGLEATRAELLATVAARTIKCSRSMEQTVEADINGKQVVIHYNRHYIPEPHWSAGTPDPFKDIRESADYRMLAAEVAKKNSMEAVRAIQQARIAAANEIEKKTAAAAIETRLQEVVKQVPGSEALWAMYVDGMADVSDLKAVVVRYILERSGTLADKNYVSRKPTLSEYDTWTGLRSRGQLKAKSIGIEDLKLAVESKVLEYTPSYDDDALVTLLVDIRSAALGINQSVEVVLAGDDDWATRH
jgi:hypothetical protein